MDVILNIYEDGFNTRYKGRCLGLLDSKQFAIIATHADIKRRLYSSSTVPLDNIIDYEEKDPKGLEGKRLAIAVKERNYKDVVGKTILVTEPISYASTIDKKCISVCTNRSYIIVEEKE